MSNFHTMRGMVAPPREHNVACSRATAPLEYALSRMRSHQIRRLVVLNEAQELVGIFALDDMLELWGEELQTIAGLMRAARGH